MLTRPTRWRTLGDGDVGTLRGRLLGGCLETISMLPGTPYGNLDAFAPGDDLLVYVEVAEVGAYTAARMLHHLRLAGWFDRATGILVGRTSAPDSSDYTQADAVRDALGGLDVPVLYDVDLGHVPPAARPGQRRPGGGRDRPLGRGDAGPAPGVVGIPLGTLRVCPR